MRIVVNKNSCVSSNLSMFPECNEASFIEIKDEWLGEGGQGKVYEIIAIDGRRVSDLLVKTFNRGFPTNLREIVSAVRGDRNKIVSDEGASLRALPLFTFEGSVNNRSLYGYVMQRVAGKSFDRIVEEHINDYINLPLESRLQLCFQFVEGMDILYALTIVHADINGQNLMIDLKNNRLSIIDLDGGAVARQGSAPIVIYKREPEWLDPRILLQLITQSNLQKVSVNIQADLWSIACGVHHLLFGLGPYFFIANAPERESYLRSYKWPQLRAIQNITMKMHTAFGYYERTYSKVPELHRLFQVSFQDGYLNSGRRVLAYQWKQAIRSQLGRDSSGVLSLRARVTDHGTHLRDKSGSSKPGTGNAGVSPQSTGVFSGTLDANIREVPDLSIKPFVLGVGIALLLLAVFVLPQFSGSRGVHGPSTDSSRTLPEDSQHVFPPVSQDPGNPTSPIDRTKQRITFQRTDDSFAVSSRDEQTDTGIDVNIGDSLIFEAMSTISLVDTVEQQIRPNGASYEEYLPYSPDKLLLTEAPIGTLIGRIGEYGQWFLVGAHLSIKSDAAGRLYLGVNDKINHFDDNEGAFKVTITKMTPVLQYL